MYLLEISASGLDVIVGRTRKLRKIYDTIVLKRYVWGKIGLWTLEKKKKNNQSETCYCTSLLHGESFQSLYKEGVPRQGPAESPNCRNADQKPGRTRELEFVKQSKTALEFCREFPNLWALIDAFVRENYITFQKEPL